MLKRMLMTTLIIAGAATTARAGDADGSWWGRSWTPSAHGRPRAPRRRAGAHRPSAGRSAAAERICAHPASGDLRTVCDELDALRASLDARLAAESRARQEAEKKLQALTRGGVAEDLQ
ncbi:MAG: hypothetical protein H6745_16445 [Deltaproteobacteria bacterium]|nr:hypothetical protein [Deltaproteobacteria bacterium]